MQTVLSSFAKKTAPEVAATTTIPEREQSRQASAAAQDAFAKSVCTKLEYLQPGDVALLGSKAKPVFFAPGESLIKEGTPAPGFYMIRSGEAEVHRGTMKLATLTVGDVCGEMSFLEASNASASVVASKASTVEFLSADELSDVFLSFPHLASRFYRSMALTLSRRLRATSQQLVAAQQANK